MLALLALGTWVPARAFEWQVDVTPAGELFPALDLSQAPAASPRAPGGGNGLVMFYDPGRRTMIHQGNVPMFVHDVAFNEDHTTLYAVGHQRIAVMELRA